MSFISQVLLILGEAQPTENLLWPQKDRIRMLHAMPSQALTPIWMSLILKLFAYDIIFANHKDERLPPPGPAHSQRNPEQFVQGSQSTARSLRVQNRQLPTEGQVFEDEVRPTTERTDQPAEEISERHDHGRNFSGKTESSFAPSHSFSQVYDLLARHNHTFASVLLTISGLT